jgi:hypothetical protein
MAEIAISPKRHFDKRRLHYLAILIFTNIFLLSFPQRFKTGQLFL